VRGRSPRRVRRLASAYQRPQRLVVGGNLFLVVPSGHRYLTEMDPSKDRKGLQVAGVGVAGRLATVYVCDWNRFQGTFMLPEENYISVHGLGGFPQLAISGDQYQALLRARGILASALALEGGYDDLVASHQEFENEVTGIAVERILRQDFSHIAFYDFRARLSPRISRVLNNCRGYHAKYAPEVVGCMGDPSFKKEAKAEFEARRIVGSEFCFMEQFRHHLQHFGAVNAVTLGSVRDKATGHNSFSATPVATRDSLQEDNSRSKPEFDNMPARVDLTLYTRAYVGTISSVHMSLRARARAQCDSAKETINRSLADYRMAHPVETQAPLFATHRDSNGKVAPFPVLPQWDEARVWLPERNG